MNLNKIKKMIKSDLMKIQHIYKFEKRSFVLSMLKNMTNWKTFALWEIRNKQDVRLSLNYKSVGGRSVIVVILVSRAADMTIVRLPWL